MMRGGGVPGLPLPVLQGGMGSINGNNPLSVFAAGTAYSLTAVSGLLTFGTTSPSLIINAPGTYLILSQALIKYNAATFAAVRTATLKLRRSNNTPADIANSSLALQTQIITALTFSLGVAALPNIIYTTTNADDVLQLHGALDVIPTAGSLDAIAAQIIAIKLAT